MLKKTDETTGENFDGTRWYATDDLRFFTKAFAFSVKSYEAASRLVATIYTPDGNTKNILRNYGEGLVANDNQFMELVMLLDENQRQGFPITVISYKESKESRKNDENTAVFEFQNTVVEIHNEYVTIRDKDGEIVHWIQDEWIEDPELVTPAIAHAVAVALTYGSDKSRQIVNNPASEIRTEIPIPEKTIDDTFTLVISEIKEIAEDMRILAKTTPGHDKDTIKRHNDMAAVITEIILPRLERE